MEDAVPSRNILVSKFRARQVRWKCRLKSKPRAKRHGGGLAEEASSYFSAPLPLALHVPAPPPSSNKRVQEYEFFQNGLKIMANFSIENFQKFF